MPALLARSASAEHHWDANRPLHSKSRGARRDAESDEFLVTGLLSQRLAGMPQLLDSLRLQWSPRSSPSASAFPNINVSGRTGIALLQHRDSLRSGPGVRAARQGRRTSHASGYTGSPHHSKWQPAPVREREPGNLEGLWSRRAEETRRTEREGRPAAHMNRRCW